MKKVLNILVLTIFAFAILASCSPETPVKPTPEEVAIIVRINEAFAKSIISGYMSDKWTVEGDLLSENFSATLKEDYPETGDKLIAGSSISVSQDGTYASYNLTAELTDEGRHTYSISGYLNGDSISMRLDGKLIDPTGIDIPDV